ncbi:MAG: hypothetical protein LBJ14_07915 [Desulfarculales bacterium]|nr:hypothetical protein [Desulfarculales bacterium]
MEKVNEESKKVNEETKYRHLTTEFIDFDDNPVKVDIRFKRPGQAICDRAIKDLSRSPGRAMSNLLMACVHPDDKSALQAAIENFPGVGVAFASEIMERTGYSAEVVNKLGKQ